MLRIQLLGGFAVWVEDCLIPESAWPLKRARTLVKLLALAPAYRLPKEEIMEALWPDIAEGAAVRRLYQTLYVARKVLGTARGETPRLVLLTESEVMLGAEADITTDVAGLERAAARARASQDVDLYRRAVETSGGDLLPGDRYQEWSRAPRERVRRLQLALLAELAQILEAEGRHVEAIDVLTNLVLLDPIREDAHRALMRCYAHNGQRAQALRHYRALQRVLESELGVEPDQATQHLHARILANAPRIAPVPYRELGVASF